MTGAIGAAWYALTRHSLFVGIINGLVLASAVVGASSLATGGAFAT